MQTREQIRAELLAKVDKSQAHLANQTPEESRAYLQRITQYQRDAMAKGGVPDVIFEEITDPKTGETYAYPDRKMYGEKWAEEIAQSVTTPFKA